MTHTQQRQRVTLLHGQVEGLKAAIKTTTGAAALSRLTRALERRQKELEEAQQVLCVMDEAVEEKSAPVAVDRYTRASLSDREKADYIREHGMRAYLKLK